MDPRTEFSELEFSTVTGATMQMSRFAGRPVLIVNTASRCGFAPQYAGLQRLHEQFRDDGLVVIGFPCDQFAHQEPGSDDEIAESCQRNHGVTFTLASKVNVNGRNAHPVFKWLRQQATGFAGSAVKWNFTKFLVWPDGTVTRYAPTTTPEALREPIRQALRMKPVRRSDGSSGD